MRGFLKVFLGLALLMTGRVGAKRKIFNIFWNTTSPMFRIDNTDNVIDINRGNLPWEYDQANIICPVYPKETRDEDVEKYIIYSVSREEYEECRITTQNPKVVAVCNKPYQLLYVTITFRSFTPTPGGLEFEPGKDYFFISTSSKRDLYRRIGGRCSTHNMRATFKVAPAAHGSRPWESQQHPSQRQQQQQQQQHGFSSTVNVPRSLDSNNRRSDVVLDGRRRPRPVFRQMDDNSLEEGGDGDAEGRRRRRPAADADLIKQEASVMRPFDPASSASSGVSAVSLSMLVSSVLLLAVWTSILSECRTLL